MNKQKSVKTVNGDARSIELKIDDRQVLLLTNRVIEFLRADLPATNGSWRWHVSHVAVEMKPTGGGGRKLTIGLDRDGKVWAGAVAMVAPDKVEAVEEFFEICEEERATVEKSG